jgi:molybdate transport system ATP-binding protein
MTASPVLDFDADAAFGTFKLAAQFTAHEGITALFGPSGAGKTTIINLIAGLSRPERGRILLSGLPLVDTGAAIFVPRHKRRMGLVYQDAQLFPHLTVEQNLHFGRWFAPRGTDDLPADAVVATLGIADILHRRPARLSGGEKQRVALARALLSAPKLLLMDEPLAGLDHDRKQDIILLIERVRDEFRVPIIYVSHGLEEVRRLASEVVVLRDGRVIASGPPADVLRD